MFSKVRVRRPRSGSTQLEGRGFVQFVVEFSLLEVDNTATNLLQLREQANAHYMMLLATNKAHPQLGAHLRDMGF